MAYINCGVKINGEHAKSKKAIKDAMVSDPASVTFYKTSPFDGNGWISVTGDKVSEAIGNSDKLSIVGPDPFTKRVFYGTVENTAKGLKIS